MLKNRWNCSYALQVLEQKTGRQMTDSELNDSKHFLNLIRS
jgi:hypothetical protein